MPEPKAIPATFSSRLREFRERWLPILAFVAAIAGVATLWNQRYGILPVGPPAVPGPSLVATDAPGPSLRP